MPDGAAAAGAFPGGRARRAVRRAGCAIATGTATGPVTWLTDRLELPRLWVYDEPAETLERRIRAVLGR